MKTKQDAVVAWLLAIDPRAKKEEADGFAARVWEKNFRHVDFMTWNGPLSDDEFMRIVSAAKNRSAASEEEVASLLERLGAFRKKEASWGMAETKRPNQTPEPTPLAVTPRACARVAPPSVVAHL